MEKERNRISLGMKDSYIGNCTAVNVTSDHDSDGGFGGNSAINDYQLSMLQNDDLPASNLQGEHEESDLPVLSQADSRAHVPPLEVTLDDMEGSELEDAVIGTKENHDEQKIVEKNRRRERKKMKEERC